MRNLKIPSLLLAVTFMLATLNRPVLGGDDSSFTAKWPVRPLTSGPSNDEDGAFTLADDGTVHFAWISNRAGNLDVWMTSSKDGIKWTDPRPAVQSPTEDLLNSLVRTKDGRYHLTGRQGSWITRRHAVYDSTSTDLIHWMKPVKWSDDGVVGFFQEAPNRDYWLMTSSPRSGNRDLYLQRSRDQGKTWNAPTAITRDPLEDFLFAFRIARDGTFLLVWERHDAKARGAYMGKSTDIYFAKSSDGLSWTPPKLLTPESGKPEADTIPSMLEGPDGHICGVWITTRGGGKPRVVGVPLWPHPDLTNVRHIPAEGYSVRGQALRDGRYLLAWVQTGSRRSNHDYFYRILDHFDFTEFEAVKQK